jgi:hypothetical protein
VSTIACVNAAGDTASDLERVQLILTARADTLGYSSDTKPQAASKTDAVSPAALTQAMVDTFPPHIRATMKLP